MSGGEGGGGGGRGRVTVYVAGEALSESIE